MMNVYRGNRPKAAERLLALVIGKDFGSQGYTAQSEAAPKGISEQAH